MNSAFLAQCAAPDAKETLSQSFKYKYKYPNTNMNTNIQYTKIQIYKNTKIQIYKYTEIQKYMSRCAAPDAEETLSQSFYLVLCSSCKHLWFVISNNQNKSKWGRGSLKKRGTKCRKWPIGVVFSHHPLFLDAFCDIWERKGIANTWSQR